MQESQASTISWPLDSPWAVESYASTLELERAHQHTLQDVLSRILQRLNLSASELLSTEQVRALFARYQQSKPAPARLLSQMVADMRDE